jgi:diguanylate cyclase (GGDEF)-like protein
LSFDVHHHLASFRTERRLPGPLALAFRPYVEAEFRRHYAESHYPKTRPLLVILLGLIFTTLIWGVILDDLSWQTAAFTLGVLIPALVATLVLSYKDGAHRGYQLLLAATAFLIGLVCTSVALRASLYGMPYYFGAQVAWLFVVWLVLGLSVGQAAFTAIGLSLMYAWGMVYWEFPAGELLFSSATLLFVNLVGAYCGWQLESAERRAFAESRTLNELADRDGLTGLYNRRRYEEHIDKLWRQSRRDQEQFTVVLIDIDHFKPYNDLYGHQAGDDALKRVAEIIALYGQRPLDFAARFGGEEFALVLYGPAEEYGRELPERLRRDIAELKIPHAESTTAAYLTVSVGVAIVTPGTERSLAGVVQLADEALYQAKEEGRNRVVIRESRLAHIQTGRFRAGRERLTA